MLISLRKAMDASLEESLQSAVDSYRSVLNGVADSGARAFPPAGETLKQSLLQLRDSLAATTSRAAFQQIGQRAGDELKVWGDSASAYYQDSAEEIKNLLLEVARAANQVGARDQRYGHHLHSLAARLEGAAKLDNLSAMRQSLTTSAVELVTCVNKMTEDGKSAVEQLRAQVTAYQQHIDEADRLASIDALTGVSSRRIVERQLERRVAESAPFSAIYFDLNEFKQVNDTLGHSAGDDLLKQFAEELRHSLRATDSVGRVGGDEFVALIDGTVDAIQERMALVKSRINGDYTVVTGSGKHKVSINAAVGVASWTPGITAEQLLDAADQAMYEDKKRTLAPVPAD